MSLRRVRTWASAGVAGLAALSLSILPTTASWTGAVTFSGTVTVAPAPETEVQEFYMSTSLEGPFTESLELGAVEMSWVPWQWQSEPLDIFVLVDEDADLQTVGIMTDDTLADGMKTDKFHFEISAMEKKPTTPSQLAGFAVWQIGHSGESGFSPSPIVMWEKDANQAAHLQFTFDFGTDSGVAHPTATADLTWLPADATSSDGDDAVFAYEDPQAEVGAEGDDSAAEGIEGTGLEIAVAGDADETGHEFASELSGVAAELALAARGGSDEGSDTHTAVIDLYVWGTHLRSDSGIAVEATSDATGVLPELVPGEDGDLTPVDGEDFYMVSVRVEVPDDAGATEPSELPLGLRLTASTPEPTENLDAWSASATVTGTLSHPGAGGDVPPAEGDAPPAEGDDTIADGDAPSTGGDVTESDEQVDTVAAPEPEVEEAPVPEPAPAEPEPEVSEEGAVGHECETCPDCEDGQCEKCDDPDCPHADSTTGREDEPPTAKPEDNEEEDA